MENFITQHIYLAGLVAGLFTWGMTALGAALIFLFKDLKQIILDSMLGFAAGVMIAASFFSLILPALDYADDFNKITPVFIVIIGFMTGVIFLRLLDRFLPHIHIFEGVEEGINNSLQRSTLLVLAITLHNIPEGLAVGVAFGAYHITGDPLLLGGAIALTIGIGIQNFPEGSAVSFPLYREGISKKRSFFYGQLSAVVEPISIILGIYLVSFITSILALALSFAAGAMMFVVVEELIPESQTHRSNRDVVTIATMLGLCTMMALDVLLG